MAAKTNALSELHEKLAKAMADKLRDGEATASDLNVIRQFLKDNGIEAERVAGGSIDKLGQEFGTPPFDPDSDIISH